MIGFRDSLPLIILEDRTAIAFDHGWFVRALNVAAQRAGYPQWWLATHIAGSVQTWLKSMAGRPTLPARLFIRAVKEALRVIGYEKIGACFEAAGPFARISLTELAHAAGNGFELAFFNALNRRLGELLRGGGSYLELHGLHQCVKLLRRQRTWSRECSMLLAEIVDFARAHSTRLCNAPGRPVRELFLHVA